MVAPFSSRAGDPPFPACGDLQDVGSISLTDIADTNTSDYQARRLNIRYRASDGGIRHAYTLNDTGCALGRMLIAAMENYQQADGAVKVPAALRSLVGKAYLGRG